MPSKPIEDAEASRLSGISVEGLARVHGGRRGASHQLLHHRATCAPRLVAQIVRWIEQDAVA